MLKEKLISAEMKNAIADIARAHRLRLVVLYGSVARDTETAMSDVDIGILGETLLSHEDEARIGEEIARAADMANVEVRSLHRVSPLFLYQVMSEGVVLFADTPSRAQELRLYAWKLSAETKRMRDLRYARVKARIEAYVR